MPNINNYQTPVEQITLDQLERYLWSAAVDLRGQIDATAYKDYIFPLVFFKRICDVYDEKYALYVSEADENYAGMMMQEEPIQIPKGSHWKDVFNTTENIGQALVNAFREIESANPGRKMDGRVVGGLEGVFGDKTIWTNKSKMPDSIIRSLLNSFNKLTLSLSACPADEMGTGYEYLIGQFADDAGHTAQEFYTNRTVVELMADLEERLGVKVINVKVGAVDFLRDMAVLRVYYDGKVDREIDEKLKLRTSDYENV